MKELDKNSSGDMDDSMLGDLGNNKCKLSSSVFFECDNKSMKKGVKVPKSPKQWASANDFFKVAFSNKPKGSSNVSDVTKECNFVIYNYFKDICGPVENNHNKRLSAK